MAKQQKISAQTRTGIGRSAVNKIKQQGLVPAVVYGGKDKPQPVAVNAREIHNLLAHATSEHVLVDVEPVPAEAAAAAEPEVIKEKKEEGAPAAGAAGAKPEAGKK